ncbi:MAG: hypothetical protein ACOY99_08905 [Pseudomonadota bacterium]
MAKGAIALMALLGACASAPPGPLLSPTTAMAALADCTVCRHVGKLEIKGDVQRGSLFRGAVSAEALGIEMEGLFPAIRRFDAALSPVYILSFETRAMESTPAGLAMTARGAFHARLRDYRHQDPAWTGDFACTATVAFAESPRDSVTRNRLAVARCLDAAVGDLIAALRAFSLEAR